MAIYPNLKVESTVQINDKTRLDARQSFITKDESAVSLVEIKPDDSSNYIDVTGSSSDDWYLDWSYATDGDKAVTVRITTDGSPVTATSTISVVSESTDNLLSTDYDLQVYEHDILRWVPDGRNSWKDKHRAARDEILAWLDENGYVDIDRNKYTAASLVDTTEFKRWATFIALRLIFQSLSNSIDDIFAKKAEKYEQHELAARKRLIIRIDTDNDGVIDDYEELNVTGRCTRR